MVLRFLHHSNIFIAQSSFSKCRSGLKINLTSYFLKSTWTGDFHRRREGGGSEIVDNPMVVYTWAAWAVPTGGGGWRTAPVNR